MFIKLIVKEEFSKAILLIWFFYFEKIFIPYSRSRLDIIIFALTDLENGKKKSNYKKEKN